MTWSYRPAEDPRQGGGDPRPAPPRATHLRWSVLKSLVAVPFALVLMSGAAWAYWTHSGAGTASAATGSINAPTSASASSTPESALVVVSWTNSTPAAGLSPAGNYVTRVRNSDGATFGACGSSAASPNASTPCNDTNVPVGTYHYVVTGVLASWTASGSSNNVTVSPDVTPPSVTVEQKSGQADPRNVLPMLWTVTFSEPVTGFDITDLTRGGTSTGGTVAVTGTGASYEISLSGSPGNGSTTFAITTSRAQDLAANLNTASTSTDNSITYDTTAATVTGVSSPLANGTYRAGQIIPVTVIFSEAVTVTGTPQLTLSTGSPATTAVNYTSGSGTSVLTFTYTVAAGNTSADLDYATATALALNGGTIKDAATNNAALTLASPAATNSLGSNKNLLIDAVAPTVSGVASTLADGTYKAGQVIPVTMTFNENVTVTGTPQLTLTTGSPATTAVNYSSGSGTSVLTFTYTVAAGNTSADLDYAGTTSLALNGGTIADAATNAATLTLASPAAAGSLGANKTLVIDTTAPTVTNVTSTLANGSYKTGQVIPVTMTFNENVTVTGTPQLTLTTGSPATTAVNYTSGSGTSVLTFSYTVAAGNISADLDYAATTSLALNSGTIKDAATNNATLTLASPAATSSLGYNKNLLIDAVAPTVTNVTSTLANGTYKTGQVIPVTVTFSEAVTVTGTPQLTLSTGSPTTTAVNYTSGTGTSVLTFTYTVAAGNTSAGLNYYAAATSLALYGGTIADAATNNATLILPGLAATGSLGTNTNLVIDAVAPTAVGFTTTNSGQDKSLTQGDAFRLTYSEAMLASSIIAGWDGTGSQNVVVRAAHGSGNDKLTVYSSTNTTLLPLGSVDLRDTAWLSTSRTFGATGTPSTITKTGSYFTITLGSPSGSTGDASGNLDMIWTPAAGATDLAGNACTTAAYAQSDNQDDF